MFDTLVDPVVKVWTSYNEWHPPLMMLYAIVGMSMASALVVWRVTGAMGLIAIPTGFVLLYYTAMVTNFAGMSFPLAGIGYFERALIFSTVGHFVGGVLLLGFFKVADR